MVEVFKEVPLYEGRYLVSNFGNVKSLDRPFKTKHGTIGTIPGKEISINVDRQGYLRVHLFDGTRWKNWLLHRVIAFAFIPNPHDYRCINHKNGKRDDNYIQNLEWCTHKQNARHSIDTCLQIPFKGEQHGCSVLSESDVNLIRAKYRGGVPRKDLQHQFSVSKSCIAAIVIRKTWKHI